MPTSIHCPPTRSAQASASRTSAAPSSGLPCHDASSAPTALMAAPIWKSRCHSDRSSSDSRAASASLPLPTMT
jgi:hypothetical protein